MKVYLAGPEVFHPRARELGAAKQALCRASGFDGLYPLDGEGTEAGAICRANLRLIEASAAVVANLTPFRGPGADAGTVFEAGFAVAAGKLVLGYRNVADRYLDRVAAWNGRPLERRDGLAFDRDGLLVEDFGLGDNLMIDCALAAGGFPVVERAVPARDRLTDLVAFGRCLRLLKDRAGPFLLA